LALEYLSVSSAILSARVQYYRSFLYSELDDNDATYFIVYNLTAIHKAIEKLNEYIAPKTEGKEADIPFGSRISDIEPAAALHCLPARSKKPGEIYTIEAHSNIHGVTYQTARTDLLGLKDMGLLENEKNWEEVCIYPGCGYEGEIGGVTL